MLDSRVLSVLSLIVTLLAALGGALQVINPEYAIWAMAISGGLSAFLTKIQGNTNKKIN